jgi:hypothetical protein
VVHASGNTASGAWVCAHHVEDHHQKVRSPFRDVLTRETCSSQSNSINSFILGSAAEAAMAESYTVIKWAAWCDGASLRRIRYAE